MNWLADKIEQWPTAKLLPYARNARTHSEEQVAQIAASIVHLGVELGDVVTKASLSDAFKTALKELNVSLELPKPKAQLNC
mgnify:CR=1 FL=1